MQTIDLSMARGKLKKLDAFLQDLQHMGHDPLGIYFAAKGVRDAALRTGTDRQLNAARKALKAFNVTVTIATNARGLPSVRLYSAIKQTEIFLT